MGTSVRIRFIHAAGLAIALGLVGATPAAAVITPTTSAPGVAGAMSDTLAGGELANSTFPALAAPPAHPAATADSSLAGFPTSGNRFSILSSGDATLAGNGQATFAGVTNGGGNGGHGTAVQDLVTLRLNLNVPASANCFSIDFRFLSEEYPTFVGSSVNDGFVAELDTSNFQGDGNAVTAPHNFAFDEGGNVISVNTAGISEANAAGTVYGGGTSLLRASTPVSPGPHSVYLSVFDQGDSNYDSAAFLDRAVMTNTPPSVCKAGASNDVTPPDTTITDGPKEGATTGVNPSFSFTSSEPGSAFQCSLDGTAYTDCANPASYADLSKGAHTFSVRAFDAAGNGDPTPASRSFKVKGGKQLATPVAGESVNLNVVNGTIKYRCKSDGDFRRVNDARQIDVGCTVDATDGKVRLTTETETGETQSAEFYDGVFKIGQKSNETEVTLKLSGELGCGKGGTKGRADKRGRRRGGRGLWGNGEGRFTTRGHHGAGTVRGTKWFVGDRCDGSTYIKVARGVVSFRDFVADKTVEVRAGERYSTK